MAARAASTRSIAGMQNAAVLPEPVSDCPTTSRPAIISGIAAAWIGAASVNPSRATASSTPGERPSAAKGTGADAAAVRGARGAESAADLECDIGAGTAREGEAICPNSTTRPPPVL